MKKIISFPSQKLLRIHFVLILTSSVRTAPTANSESRLHLNFLPKVSDSEEQMIQELGGNKTAELTKDELQVLDELILDEADGLLSSGANLLEVSPTTEDLVHDQPNNTRVDFEEVTAFSKDLDFGGATVDAELMQVRQRLQKLDFYFEFLRVMSEDCRQRMLCEVMREPGRFYPLSSVLEDATSFTGSYQYLTSQLVNTTEGARLMSYLEASFRGQDRTRTCSMFQYRCPSRTEEMINYDALCLWREMVRWLTVHVIAKAH